MRELILLNPRGRKNRSRVRSRRRKTTTRRKKSVRRLKRSASGRFVRRNPVKKKASRSKATLRKTKKTPTPTKPMARRKKKSSFRKTVKRYTARARKAARRLGRRASRVGRRVRRSASREGKGILKNLTGAVSKDNLQLAGGVVAAGFVNGLVQRQFGAMLPMNNTTIGKLAYTIAVPVLASIAVRRFAPKVAQGLALGGLITAVNQAVGMVAPQFATGGFASYIDATPPQPMLPYPTGSIGATTGSVDSGSRTSASLAGYSGIYDSPMPFQSDAWSN